MPPPPPGSLQLLEQQVVGGEQAKNKDLKEKRKRRKRFADERTKQLAAALRSADEDGGDWVLLRVYDSIQEEVRAKGRLLEKVQRKVRPSRARRRAPPAPRRRWRAEPPAGAGRAGVPAVLQPGLPRVVCMRNSTAEELARERPAVMVPWRPDPGRVALLLLLHPY